MYEYIQDTRAVHAREHVYLPNIFQMCLLTMFTVHISARVPLVVVIAFRTDTRVASLATDATVHAEHSSAVADACCTVSRQIVLDPASVTVTRVRFCSVEITTNNNAVYTIGTSMHDAMKLN